MANRWESRLRDVLFLACLAGGFSLLGASIVPVRRERPAVRHPNGAERADLLRTLAELDTFLANEQAEAGLTPTPLAPVGQVARRLSIALVGAVPSLEELRLERNRWTELERRLAADPADAQAADLHREETLAWTDRLIDNPADRRHGDYFAERFARALVGTHQDPFILYRRRRFVLWLSEQIRNGRPFDEVARDLIASRGVWTDRPAVNFVTSTIKPGAGDNRPDAEELASATARAFLGIRLDCAQCHDHPFVKEWKQSSFRGLAAFYGQARLGLSGIRDDLSLTWRPEVGGEKLPEVLPAVPFLPDLLPPGRARGTTGKPETGDVRPDRERLAEWLTHPENPYFARAVANRVWALLWGRPLAEPLDDFVTAGNIPPLLDKLGEDFRTHGYDLRRLIRLIAALRAYRGDSAAEFEITPEHETHWAAFPLTRLRPEQVVGGTLQGTFPATIDEQSHILLQFIRFGEEQKFTERYGDAGGDEMQEQGGTIPQRLLMMNGELVDERLRDGPLAAAAQIAFLARDDAHAVETAYWALLTRAPTPAEATHFEARLRHTRGNERERRVADLFWALLNSTEFSWNH